MIETEIEIVSGDGTLLSGVVDRPTEPPGATVIMVSGTGLFDRDVRFGTSKGDRDLIFRDLAIRLANRKIASIRYDRRGVRFGDNETPIDRDVISHVTTSALRDDLGAIYDYARRGGPTPNCIILLGHSEGMAHIGRLAETGRPAPTAVVGIGGLLESPQAVLKWQLSGRDQTSLRLLDQNGDGTTTNDEVRSGFFETPSAVFGEIGPFIHPEGAWNEDAVKQVGVVQTEMYEAQKAKVLSMDPDLPYPSESAPVASYEWWQSWFTDDRPVAERLAKWRTQFSFYYGSIDSQVKFERQMFAIGRAKLAAHVKYYTAIGHTLGKHVLFGPIEESVAEEIADDIARTADLHCK